MIIGKPRHFLAATALCGVFLGGPASATDTHAAWDGFIGITASSSGCAGLGGVQVGDHTVVVYRPRFATGDTTTVSAIAVYFLRSSYIVENTGAGQMNASNGSYKAYLVDSKARLTSSTGTFNITTVPAVVTATTTDVKISGTINGTYGVTGCNVTFSATLTPET